MKSVFFPKNARSSGMSMTSVLIGLGLTGILAVALNQLLSNSFKGSKNVELKADVLALRHMLLSATSCSLTMPLGTCTANTDMELLRKTGSGSQVLVKNPTGTDITRIGDFAVRAKCNATGNGLDIRFARLKPGKNVNSNTNSDFIPDPLTGKTSTWDDNSSLLFAAGIEICPGNGEPRRRWVDVTSSRSASGSYVNDTGREIQVSISVYSGATFKRCQSGIKVDGETIDSSFSNNNIGAALCSAQAIVPAGATYGARIEMTPPAAAGENTIQSWREFR